MPRGFGTWKAPPGAGRFSRTGLTTTPTAVSAVATIPIATIGRHLGDGSVPLGKKNSRYAIPTAVGPKMPVASAPTMPGAGRDPGWVASPATA
jgi:hypothetical protein